MEVCKVHLCHKHWVHKSKNNIIMNLTPVFKYYWLMAVLISSTGLPHLCSPHPSPLPPTHLPMNAFKFLIIDGVPEWLSWLSAWLWLSSWSHHSWVWAPRWALCWQLRAWSLLPILCLSFSLPAHPPPAPRPASFSLSKLNNKKIKFFNIASCSPEMF